ncbi:MAG: ROK family protein [Pseudomonadota bacterium]
MNASPRIGIDLGGTKIEIAALGVGGEIIYTRRVPTPAPDYGATLSLIAEIIEDAEAELGGSATVGIGTPGSLSPKTGLLRNSNSVWMNGKPLASDLIAKAGRDLRFANDANCFALSEAVDGAGAGAHSVFGVIIGTGCGGGLVLDGKIIHGANGIGGEWGHNPLPWPNDSEHPPPPCWCGRAGCQEVWLSGSGLARDHQAVTGRALSGEEIVRQADEGDADCARTLDRHAERLARGLASICNVFDPEVIVLGGGLSRLPHLYEQVPAFMEPFMFSDHVTTRILPPKHGDASGVRGAAWLW